ncbi:tetratricopeptide repeat protein [Carboxylicivirga sp. M1479]|uniref:ATP-binding protein n=1 Tax=Carboxylicivirga sp. M1479 TaxID=2594476 RepID=UPI001177FA08|nr:tetratricopeptide repeat protein [Carboxylicivirga sp. M1479]TRX71877.1 tetratricopeptide repeat protein [Carboxylicivirga sp. M1479]
MTTKLSKHNTRARIFYVFVLFIPFLCLSAQQADTDLQHEAYKLVEKAKTDVTKEEKISLCKKAINSIQKSDNMSFKFDINYQAAIILYQTKQFSEAKKAFDYALSVKSYASDIVLEGDIQEYLGWISKENNNYDEAILHFNSAINVFTLNKQYEKLANTYNSIGAMYWYLRDYPQALENFSKVLSIGEEIDNTPLIRKGLTNKGVVLNTLAHYNQALICFERALEINQYDNDLYTRAVLLNNIGNINTELKHYDHAINNFTEALEIHSKLENKEGLSDCYNNLGEVYLDLGNIILALENYQISLSLFKEEGDSGKIAASYLNIGRAHQHGKQYSKAISYFEKTLKIILNLEDPSIKAETYLHLGQTLMINQHYEQAKDYLDQALELSNSLQEQALKVQTLNSLSEWCSLQGRYKEALHYKTQYSELKDDITDEQALQSSARMEAVYKSLRKDEQISLLQQDNIDTLASLELARNSHVVYLVITGLLLLLVIVLFLAFRMKRKTERLLKDKNRELKELNSTKDKFFSIIAHDLKSPFSSLMGFAEMLTLNAESKNTKEVIEYSQIIHNSTKRLLGLVENLLQWSRTQIGTTEFRPSQLDISIQTHNIVSLLRLNAEEKDIVISPKIERNLVAWADENLYNTVLRNLISNAIKFSRIGSVIYVRAGIKNDMIQISVADSGVGIRQENLEKLFMVDSTFSTKGTLNEKGTGLGLVLCKEFVEINQGQIWAESSLEKGSTFYFTLPLFNKQ